MYMYWDNENQTYIRANAVSNHTANTGKQNDNSHMQTDKINEEKDKNSHKKEHGPNDKVKVAKKIVKDMEKWAKQLNQKKDMSYMPIASTSNSSNSFNKAEDTSTQSFRGNNDSINTPSASNVGYADVGFSILEKKEKAPIMSNYIVNPNETSNVTSNKLIPSYGSDSDNDDDNHIANEKDYVDFEKLTCLLCKRAFQSLEILNKHLKMSNLHKDNLEKFNLQRGGTAMSSMGGGNNHNSQRYFFLIQL